MAKKSKKSKVTGAYALALLLTLAIILVVVAYAAKGAEWLVGDADRRDPSERAEDRGRGVGAAIVGAIRGAAEEGYEWVTDVAGYSDDDGEDD